MEARKDGMDDSTFNHFSAWCMDNLHDDELDAEVDRKMLDEWAAMDADDRERVLSHGWSHLYRLVK